MIRAPNTLRAVSYNLLADQFAYHHTYCPPQALQWPHRIARILHQLVELDSDLLFLQEVEHRVYHQQLQATLDTLGYDSLYCSTRPNPEEDFGPVLAYRRDRLGLSHPESKRTCTFCSALNSWHPPAVDAPDDAFHGPLRTHGEGAAMAMLHTTTGPPSSAQTVVAVSTHLHWDPRLPDVKATQAAVLCSEVERFRKSMGAPDAAVIIGGDFNSLPEKRQPDAFDPKIAETGLVSGAYTIMTQGYMATDHPDHPVVRRALSSTSQVCLVCAPCLSTINLPCVTVSIS